MKITNTGKLKGKDVVQMYIRDHYGSLARPVKELKGFELVELNPGETKEVSFEIDNSKFLIGLAVDTFIHQDFRKKDPFILLKMYKLIRNELK